MIVVRTTLDNVISGCDVVVCGHSDCGAVKAVLNPPPADALPSVSKWLAHGAGVRTLLAAEEGLEGKARINRAIELNVLLQLSNLCEQPAVAAAIAEGRLQLHGWVYDIGEGAVRAFDPTTGTFERLGAAATPVDPSALPSVSS